MAPSFQQMPSPAASEFEVRDTPIVGAEFTPTGANMLKIQNLLNPTASQEPVARDTQSISPPRTPTSTQTLSGLYMSRSGSPFVASSTKSQSPAKGTTAYRNDDIKSQVNYPPYECTEVAHCLSLADQQELARQHKSFQINPAGDEEHGGSIFNNTRHIPYSSDKKSFTGRTGKDGFNVFQYKFNLPNEQPKWDVMWDYNNGLVRITPFFKACGHSKTIPAKAINANAGLKDLSYSITGGALIAQGYWMPYECARELCSTFCYDIRWAMTPIFGPSFVHQCLRKDHPGFGKFKISSETVHNAALQEQAWRTPTPQTSNTTEKRVIPRSVPDGSAETVRQHRIARPTFRQGSPFASGSNSKRSDDMESPDISPKTSFSSPVWTSINRRRSPKTPQNTPVGSLATSLPLLAQPYRYSRHSANPGDESYRESHSVSTTTSEEQHFKRSNNKRRRSTRKRMDPDDDYVDSQSGYDAEGSDSESDDEDITITTSSSRKRIRRDFLDGSSKHTSSSSKAVGFSKGDAVPQSCKYSAQDVNAAKWLLNLSMRDSELTKGPTDAQSKRKVSLI